MDGPVVEARNLHKSYGDVVARDSTSFNLQHSESSGLLELKGAGKTSTLESLERASARRVTT